MTMPFPTELRTGPMTVVVSALVGGGLSLAGLTRAVEQANPPDYRWLTVVVAVTGLLTALASLAAALATFFRARADYEDGERPRRRRRR